MDINKCLEQSLSKIEQGKNMNLKEILTVTAYLGGYNPMQLTPQDMAYKINSLREDLKFKDRFIVTSPDSSSYIIGELIELYIKDTKIGNLFLNMQFLILSPIIEYIGNDLGDVLMNLPNGILKEIIQNSLKIDLISNRVQIETFNDLELQITKYNILDNSNLIINIENECYVIENTDFNFKIKYIEDLYDINQEFEEIESLENLENKINNLKGDTDE